MSTRIHIIVEDELLAQIDAARGDTSRSKFFTRAAEASLVDIGTLSRELQAKMKDAWKDPNLLREMYEVFPEFRKTLPGPTANDDNLSPGFKEPNPLLGLRPTVPARARLAKAAKRGVKPIPKQPKK